MPSYGRSLRVGRPAVGLVNLPQELRLAVLAREVVGVHVVVGRNPDQVHDEVELDHEQEELLDQAGCSVAPRATGP